jgi:hypothetical protein
VNVCSQFIFLLPGENNASIEHGRSDDSHTRNFRGSVGGVQTLFIIGLSVHAGLTALNNFRATFGRVQSLFIFLIHLEKQSSVTVGIKRYHSSLYLLFTGKSSDC